MRRLVIACAAFAAFAACFESHQGTQELRSADCVVCHLPQYQATTAPGHVAIDFPTTCGDCHLRTNWQPALEGRHPAEDVFPIRSGGHVGVDCQECHALGSGPSRGGANTRCTACHPDDTYQRTSHEGATSTTGVAYRYQADVPSFCLACHPKGTAKKHPNDKFPRSGPHDTACTSCHLRATGADTRGANASCIEAGCHHTLAYSDGKHREVRDYAAARNGPWTSPHLTSRNFCLLCHPRGRD